MRGRVSGTGLRPRWRGLWFVWLLALAAGAVQARESDYLVDRWGTADGLPVNIVGDLHMSPSGYLWMVTFDGLVRFDGHRFAVFDSGSDPALPSNRLTTLTETPNGWIWVTTEQMALASFDGRRFRVWGEADGLPDARVTTPPYWHEGRLWIGTLRGPAVSDACLGREPAGEAAAARFDCLPDHGARFHPVAADAPPLAVHALLLDEGGRMLVGSDLGLDIFENGELREHLDSRHGLPQAPVLSIGLDRSGTLWIGTGAGAARRVEGRFQSVGIAEPVLRIATDAGDAVALSSAHADYLWRDGELTGVSDPHHVISGRERWARIAPDGALWRNRRDVLERDGVPVLSLPCPIGGFDFDLSGAVWVASSCNGLQRLHRREVETLTEVAGLPLGKVYGMAQDREGALWMVTLDRGVAAWRPDGSGRRFDSAHGFIHDNLGTLLAEPDGTVWVARPGLCRMQGEVCRAPPDMPAVLGSATADVRALHRDAEGALWVGARSGLWRWHQGVWTLEDTGMAPIAIVRAIAATRDGSLWFGTLSDGLFRRLPDGRYLRHGVEQGLSSLAIRDIHQDRDGQLWVATENRGLCRSLGAEGERYRFACIGRDRGLWSDSLHRILADARDRLWFNSNHGVFRIERSALSAAIEGRTPGVIPQVYTERDGLINREGNGGVQGAGLRLSDGRLAFPTQEGVVLIDPERERPASGDLRVAIEAVRLPGGASSLPEAGVTTLPQGERSLSILYTGLSPRLTDPLYFRYRLLPDSDWADLGDNRQLHINHLPAGNHTVEIVALDGGGNASPPARLRLVLPPWPHETAAFRLGLPALLGLAALAAMWRQRHVARRRQQTLERIVASRTTDLRAQQASTERALATVRDQRDEIERLAMSKTRFFADVSHELLTPLALLVGPLDDFTHGRAPSPELVYAMARNAHRLERLIGQLLDLERIDARRFPLRPRTLDLVELARESVVAFAPLAVREGIALETGLPDAPLRIRGDAEQMMRVLGNLLSNALKFSPAQGRVRVALEAHGGGARLAVDDSGPGVPPPWRERIFDRFSQMGSEATRAREGAGLGLALCREVVQLHGGRLYARDGELGGAGIVLELPAPEDSPLAETAEAEETAPPPASPPAVSIPALAPAQDTHPSDVAAGLARQGMRQPTEQAPFPQDHGQIERPSENAPGSAQSGAAGQPSATESGARPLVLLAEDNPDLRAYLSAILAASYRVAAAEDGEIALQLARVDAPDLIVADLMMPRLDGLGLARAIRAEPELAGVPIVFLTARASDADRIAGLSGGADHYLTKPFDSGVLLAQIAAALRACQRLRERYAQAPPPLDPAGDAAAAPGRTPFAQRLERAFATHFHDPDFGVEAIAAALHLTSATLRRRCQAEFETGPAELLRRHRLERAAALLRERAGSVSEIAYAVGYASLSAFSRAYREHFGYVPMETPRS